MHIKYLGICNSYCSCGIDKINIIETFSEILCTSNTIPYRGFNRPCCAMPGEIDALFHLVWCSQPFYAAPPEQYIKISGST